MSGSVPDDTDPGGTTLDGLLDGRVRLRQPRTGLRAGLDSVLLAAAVPVRSGERVLELGCGTGAAFLCLAARVPGITVVAVELAPVLVTLARANAAGQTHCAAEVIQADAADPGLAARIGLVAHALANPPWWPDGTAPPSPLRRTATHAGSVMLQGWVTTMARTVRPRGTATLILPASRFDVGVTALRLAGFGAIRLRPVVARDGADAIRVVLTGRRASRSPGVLRPALVLHEADGTFTAAAQAILRDAAAVS